MTKRSRRARQKGAKRSSELRVEVPQVEQEPAAPDQGEYRYVATDLKRLAILAAAMFALLIVLSFFIR
jgi:hypothetical protein